MNNARPVEQTDIPTIREWWSGHGEGEFPEKLLPPLGVVVESEGLPVCALWLFMAVGVGVCFAEFPVSKPGLSMSQAKEAFTCAVGALEAAAKANDYSVMVCHTLPPIARIMRGMGFLAESKQKVTMEKNLWL